MKKQLLRYANYSVVFQEVPDEISLAINITECPHHCVGCHSAYLCESTGNYVNDDLEGILDQYIGTITCVCFMGGEQHLENLLEWLKRIKNDYGLKTCVYSGADSLDVFYECMPYLDYLKLGHYDEKLGGLSSSNTNQKFYTVIHSPVFDDDVILRDDSSLFRRELKG